MKFVDYVTITVRSGKGGAGAVSFRRAKYVPKGGPDGGDGGDGGTVRLLADSHLYTLLDHRYNRHHYAENGHSGGSNNKKGKDGQDITLRVPVGTVVRNTDTEELITEMLTDGEEFVLAPGGRGGKGNDFFKSATHQTPRHAQPGEPGVEINITLELKLLADVGLVGFPNAGKSTLVSSLSAARPKVADYPFTTLEPSLGVVAMDDFQSFVIADIPGIIEGASEGKGLGIQFLKHIERNAVLLFLIPTTSEDVASEYATLLGELEAFNPDMLTKPRMLGISKTDLLPADELAERMKEIRSELPSDVQCLAFSSVSRKGLDELRHALWAHVQSSRSFDTES